MTFYENDLVVLLVDHPETGLHRGDVGTVIRVFGTTANHPAGFIIEFLDKAGRVRAETDITDRTQIMKLRFTPDLGSSDKTQHLIPTSE
jgi:hypothetical protein